MNLRTRAIVLSTLPLALTLLLALPEGILQFEVIQLAAQSEHAAQSASAARDVTDARVAETLALRKILNGEPQAPGTFEQARAGLTAAAERLVKFSEDPGQHAKARLIAARVQHLQQLIARVVRAYRLGDMREAAALHSNPLFDRNIDALQSDV